MVVLAAPISQQQLSRLLQSHQPPTDLWLMMTDANSLRILHVHVLVDFHVTFMREHATYMDAQVVLEGAIERLKKRCEEVRPSTAPSNTRP